MKRIQKKIFRTIGDFQRRIMQKKWRSKINNKDISIICSTCMGGVIYHNLGMEFLSPTINLYMSNLDFVKFACNLKEYCSADLEFYKSEHPFPVAHLKNITIYFNHSKSDAEAANDWNRRKQRINYDNLYLIFYYREGYTLEQIREIEAAQCKKVAVLTHKPLDLEYAVYMKGNGNPSQNFLEKDRFGIMSFEKEWDFVSWLNG